MILFGNKGDYSQKTFIKIGFLYLISQSISIYLQKISENI